MNTVAFTGRLGADPERRSTNSGKTVCSFSLAVKRPHAKDTSDWIDFVVFGQSAEFLCNYAKKGDMVAAQGILTRRSWEAKDGSKRYSYEVLCDLVELLQNRSSASGDKIPAEEPKTAQTEAQSSADDLGGFEELFGEELPF